LFNPEFLTEKTPDKDFEHPDRQIVGFTKKSKMETWEVMNQLPDAPMKRIMPAYVAEFVKYAANTFLAMKVAKNNELYDVFKKFGGTDKEFEMLAEGMGSDTRIGFSHLKIWHNGKKGYDGKCLPKDVKAFIKYAKKLGVETPITSVVDSYNDKILSTYNSDSCHG